MENSKEYEDMSLWDSFRKGNNEAYTVIYKKYVNTLYAQGFQFTKNKEVIQDCMQEVFTRIYKNRFNLSPTDNIKNYLMASMRNQLLLTLSKEKIHADISFNDSSSSQNIEESVEEVIISQEEMIILKKEIDYILSALTGRQREAIYYRYIQCLDNEEICSIMNLNYQSLRNILSRSFKKIREHLKIISKK